VQLIYSCNGLTKIDCCTLQSEFYGQQMRLICRVLGKHLARGTPTPKTWIRRHGDQRVPLMLTVASNCAPYRLPAALQEVIHAERQAAERAAEIAANPPPAPESTVGRIAEAEGQDAGIAQSRTISACSRDLGRQASQISKQTSQTSRCMSGASVHSAASNLSLNQRDRADSGSV
jgi:hypothetical protein